MEKTSNNFDILDKVALFEIFKNVPPWDVLNLCKVNKRFSEICKNEVIFSLLLKYYFPGITISENPKKQYINLIEKSPRYYTIKLSGEKNEYIEKGEEAHFYGFEIPENLPRNFTWFRTDNKFDKEGYYWLAFTIDPIEEIYYITICKTFEQALEECFANADEIIIAEKDVMIKKLKKYGVYEEYHGNGMKVFSQVVEIALFNK